MATSDACATRSVAGHYRASAWEQWWASHIADIRKWHPDGCEALCQGACAKVVSNSSHFITAWLSLQRARETSAAGSHVRDEHAAGLHPFLSYFRGVSACSGRVSMAPIEPLVGSLRHPHHDCVKRSSASASKAYLLPAWSAEVLPAPRRRFFFDCGASLYRSGSGGASQQWFVDGYARRGLAFDRTLAWEFENHTDAAIRRPLPPALRAATTIYRHPADAPPGRLVSDRLSYFNFGIDGVRGSARNPLEHLRALAAPGDFVVFKLESWTSTRPPSSWRSSSRSWPTRARRASSTSSTGSTPSRTRRWTTWLGPRPAAAGGARREAADARRLVQILWTAARDGHPRALVGISTASSRQRHTARAARRRRERAGVARAGGAAIRVLHGALVAAPPWPD